MQLEHQPSTCLLQKRLEIVSNPDQRNVVIEAVASSYGDISALVKSRNAVQRKNYTSREPSTSTDSVNATPAALWDYAKIPHISLREKVPNSRESVWTILQGMMESLAAFSRHAKHLSSENDDWFMTNSSSWETDVFPSEKLSHGWRFFESGYKPEWLVLCISVVGLCMWDYLIMQRIPDTFGWHLLSVGFWIMAALGYDAFVWWYRSSSDGINWVVGYVLEWMLSMENLLMIHLVFTTYKTPANQIHKAVFVGIVGAVLMRLIFFMAFASLLQLFDWVRFIFGAFLIWSGIEAARESDEDKDVMDTRMVRGLKWLLGSRLLENYDKKGSIFVYDDTGRLQVTVLFLVICALELADIVFAVDSVTAKISQIPQEYIAFSSSVLAMFGLRATFFILQDLLHMFDMLKYGLCIILIFIGIELMLARWLNLRASTVCIVILAVFFFKHRAVCCEGAAQQHRDQASIISSW